MKKWLKERWKHACIWTAALPGAIWLALRWPYLVVGLATIPIENIVSRRFNFTPVMGRLFGFALFMALVLVSWYAMEAVVFLATVAIAAEAFILMKKVKDRFDGKHIPVLVQAV